MTRVAGRPFVAVRCTAPQGDSNKSGDPLFFCRPEVPAAQRWATKGLPGVGRGIPEVRRDAA